MKWFSNKKGSREKQKLEMVPSTASYFYSPDPCQLSSNVWLSKDSSKLLSQAELRWRELRGGSDFATDAIKIQRWTS